MKKKVSRKSLKSKKRILRPKKPTPKKLDKQILDLCSSRVKERDRVCRMCASSYKLSAHHVRLVRHTSTRYMLCNLILLCWPCHSVQKLQPELFHDRVINVVGQPFYDLLREMSGITVHYKVSKLLEIKEWMEQRVSNQLESK